jgi:hypothetical protein
LSSYPGRRSMGTSEGCNGRAHGRVGVVIRCRVARVFRVAFTLPGQCSAATTGETPPNVGGLQLDAARIRRARPVIDSASLLRIRRPYSSLRGRFPRKRKGGSRSFHACTRGGSSDWPPAKPSTVAPAPRRRERSRGRMLLTKFIEFVECGLQMGQYCAPWLHLTWQVNPDGHGTRALSEAGSRSPCDFG